MTVSNTKSYITATGNNATRVWPYAFLIPTNSQVVTVWDATNGPVQLLPSQYTITGLDNPNGGTVTYPITGPVLDTDHTITIERILAPVQLVDLSSQGSFYPSTLEGMVDYVTMLYQQLAFLASRTVQIPVGSPVTPEDYLLTLQQLVNQAAQSAADAAASAQAASDFVNQPGIAPLGPLSPAANTFAYYTSTTAAALTSLTAFGRSLIDDVDAPTARSTLGLVIGSNVQAYDATLGSLAGLTTAADQTIYSTGVDTFAMTSLTTFARTLIDDTTQAAMQSTLGLVIGTNVQAFDATTTKNAAVQTLTNKTIDAANNTISNIANANISATAAIDASKIANGQVSNTEFQYLDGVTSSIQTQINNVSGSVPLAATVAPLMDGSAAVGVATKWAREDHVHPTDTSRAPLNNAGLTGVPTAPTATAGTNTTQIATTQFVTTAIAGSVAGVSSFNTRQGAVTLLLTDVTGVGGAPIASPTFTGTPAGPTATAGTSTTQLATTQFVAASFAPLASPTFTGTPTAPTATAGTSTGQLATTQFVATSFAPLASPTFTGTPSGPTATAGTATTQFATTQFVATALGSYAPLASPTFTGTPAAPTASFAVGLGSTQLATTAYVRTGVTGTNATDPITSGQVGEFLSNNGVGGIGLTTGVAINVVTLTLPSGDWDVWGVITLSISASITNFTGSVSQTSNTHQAPAVTLSSAGTFNAVSAFPVPHQRIAVSGSITVWTVASAGFSSGTVTATNACAIYARRRR